MQERFPWLYDGSTYPIVDWRDIPTSKTNGHRFLIIDINSIRREKKDGYDFVVLFCESCQSYPDIGMPYQRRFYFHIPEITFTKAFSLAKTFDITPDLPMKLEMWFFKHNRFTMVIRELKVIGGQKVLDKEYFK
jgi:hypothetical protein